MIRFPIFFAVLTGTIILGALYSLHSSNAPYGTPQRFNQILDTFATFLMLFVCPLFVLQFRNAGFWIGVIFFWGLGITSDSIRQTMDLLPDESQFFLYGGIVGCLYCLPWYLIARAIRRVYDTPVPPQTVCRKCGYDLRATPHRCPECGMRVAA